MRLAVSAVAGFVFGLGLLVSGMTQPAKVIAFLDVTRAWDPSLMVVMASALAINALVYWRLARRRPTPLFEPAFHLPTRRDIDLRLVLGAALFGIGWGLGGLCPGPGQVAAAGGSVAALAFVAAMLAGMRLQHVTERVRARRR